MTGWALVKDHLLLLLPNLTDLDDPDAVWNGSALSRALPLYYAEVGASEDTNRGFREMEHEDYGTAETGEVLVRFTARSGDSDLEPLEDKVDSWVDALQANFHADKTLGGTLRQSSNVTVGRVDMQAAQSKDGAIVQNTVAVRYFTRVT